MEIVHFETFDETTRRHTYDRPSRGSGLTGTGRYWTTCVISVLAIFTPYFVVFIALGGRGGRIFFGAILGGAVAALLLGIAIPIDYIAFWRRWDFRFDYKLAIALIQWTQAPGRGCPLNSTISDLPYYYLLRQWLHGCNKSHRACFVKQSYTPTRLISVGSFNAPELRLIETETERSMLLNSAGYSTLSYTWGAPTDEEKDRFCTTANNYQQRLRGFCFDDLPKTFQDAVIITRILDLRFLWVDALCIIQTDLEAKDSDWSKESKRMGDIFASGHINISATCATNWNQGFLQPTFSARSKRAEEKLQQLSKHFFCLKLHILSCCTPWRVLRVNDFKDTLQASRLNNRAWVLQERLLSRRILHFADNSTYWECGTNVRCDDLRELRCGAWMDYFFHDPEFPMRLKSPAYNRTIECLVFLFREYAQFGLTKSSDREIAIFGLLGKLQHVWDTDCRHGVFAAYIHPLLLWRRQAVVDRTTSAAEEPTYEHLRLPSWSWMRYSRIEFLQVKNMKVPPLVELQFDPDHPHSKQLLVRVHVVQHCKRGGQRNSVVNLKEEVIGDCWLDTDIEADLQQCVIVGEKRSAYWVLFVEGQQWNDRYARIGVGKMPFRYVSHEFRFGRLG